MVHHWGVQILNAIAQFLSRVDSIDLTLVAQKLDCANHWINHYPADSVIDFHITFSLDSDLSGGKRHSAFEQLGPDCVLEIYYFISKESKRPTHRKAPIV